MTNRLPPYTVFGQGEIEYFACATRTLRNVKFNHHCKLLDTRLVVDGCVFAEWTPGEIVTTIFARTDEDSTTEEVHSD